MTLNCYIQHTHCTSDLMIVSLISPVVSLSLNIWSITFTVFAHVYQCPHGKPVGLVLLARGTSVTIIYNGFLPG